MRSYMCCVAVLAAALAACSGNPSPDQGVEKSAKPSGTQYLRDLAQSRNIQIGAAIGKLFASDKDGEEFKAVVRREFNVITPENDLKHERVHPERNVYNFARVDSMLAFAEANGMGMRGHTLAWHRQLAPWLTNGNWTQEEAKALFVEHINSVVGHYKGRIAVWDVVNEAVNDSGALRPSFYARAVGPDYIALAFRTAAAADPQAQLYYNDYNIEGINQKSDSVYKMVKALRAAGVPIHGVGFQGHFVVDDLPPSESMRANFARFAELGLKLQFTEVDIRLRLPTTPEQLESQGEDYRAVFEVCTQTPECNAVVIWGVTDRDSWIPQTFRGTGDALLFNQRFNAKPAYFAVHNFLSGK